jgi:hypothetical protein
MKAKALRVAMLVTLGLSIFLLVALAVCEVLPVTNGNNDAAIQRQTDEQLTRTELMVKDVFALAYRPATGRAQSVSELQIQLPAFQRVQNGLMNGDASLGLPVNPSNGVKLALLDAQPDYLQLVAAVQAILTHPDSNPDLTEVNIVAGRERPYISSMYTVVTLLQQEAQTRVTQLQILKMTLIALVVIFVLLKYLLFTHRVIKKMIDEENATNNL